MAPKWDSEAERRLLLYVVKHCDLKPSADTFKGIAGSVGEGFNDNACKSVL